MSENILVSVVVPVYNASKYLKECLDSILNQTYQRIELICVDDGSIDDSLMILEKYVCKDSRVKLLTKKNEGKGAAGARNLGMDNATGDYIIFLDSDDFFELDMIESMLDKAYSTKADLVLCRAERWDDRTHSRDRDYEGINFTPIPHNDPFNYNDCPDTLFQIADWIVWNKLFRRTLLVENNLRFEAIPISDDQYVPVLALVLADRITVVDKIFVHYRMNTGSSQIDRQSQHPEAAYLATYSVTDKLREYGVYDRVRKSYLNIVIRVFREYFDRMKDYEKLQELYYRYIEIEFPRLDAENLTRDFFYDHRLWEWYDLIRNNSLEKILFMSARGHGDSMTTAILRFQVPLSEIEIGSKIVIVGKGRIGRYWYSQLLLSEICDVLAWVAKEEDIPKNVLYDKILYAG